MSQALTANMAGDLDLPDGYIVEWAAIDATGADVAGVIVNNVSIFGTMLGSAASSGGSSVVGPFMLVPGPGA